MEDQPVWKRMSFQECMELARIPSTEDDDKKQNSIQRFQSRQPAWKPGQDLVWGEIPPQPSRAGKPGPAAYGGHVYAQAALAAARAVEAEERDKPADKRLAIHCIQGVFTKPGISDRPYIFEVSDTASTRSFSTRLVNVRQPTESSSNPAGPFPDSDSKLPLGNVAFTCITTFKRPVKGTSDVQPEPSPQERFASILQSRAPHEWEVSPQADSDLVREAFPAVGHGTFPMIDMHKVDMTSFNEGKPMPERRQLILYRPCKPILEDDVNGHISVHAYESDRNGLLMAANHLGYGYSLGHVASLTYSFYVNVNADEAVMRGDGWWVQEIWWPRFSAGRVLQETKLWSPEGKHVASGYQDGIVMPANVPKESKM